MKRAISQSIRADGGAMTTRKITNNGGNKIIGKFPSLKLNKIVWYESLLERDYLYLLEFDPDVVSFQEQPGRIYYTRDGKKRRYTPDLLVQRRNEIHIVEVKPKKKLVDEKFVYLFRIARHVCRREGYKFKVATEELIRLQPRLNNIKLLYKYARTPIHPQHQISCYEFFVGKQAASLGELMQFFASRNIGPQVVYALIYWGMVAINLMEPVSAESVIHLPMRASAARKVS